MRSAGKVVTINQSDDACGAAVSPRFNERARCRQMDYEDAAKKLIMYSRGVAKGSIGTAYGMSMGEDPVLEYVSRHEEAMTPSELAKTLGQTIIRSAWTHQDDRFLIMNHVLRFNADWSTTFQYNALRLVLKEPQPLLRLNVHTLSTDLFVQLPPIRPLCGHRLGREVAWLNR